MNKKQDWLIENHLKQRLSIHIYAEHLQTYFNAIQKERSISFIVGFIFLAFESEQAVV